MGLAVLSLSFAASMADGGKLSHGACQGGIWVPLFSLQVWSHAQVGYSVPGTQFWAWGIYIAFY